MLTGHGLFSPSQCGDDSGTEDAEYGGQPGPVVVEPIRDPRDEGALHLHVSDEAMTESVWIRLEGAVEEDGELDLQPEFLVDRVDRCDGPLPVDDPSVTDSAVDELVLCSRDPSAASRARGRTRRVPDHTATFHSPGWWR